MSQSTFVNTGINRLRPRETEASSKPIFRRTFRPSKLYVDFNRNEVDKPSKQQRSGTHLRREIILQQATKQLPFRPKGTTKHREYIVHTTTDEVELGKTPIDSIDIGDTDIGNTGPNGFRTGFGSEDDEDDLDYDARTDTLICTHDEGDLLEGSDDDSEGDMIVE